MKSILITGAAGSIGSALVERLLRDPHNRVTGVDNLLTGFVENLPPVGTKAFTFVRADVNDAKEIGAVFQSTPFDFVFHYAAVVGVKRTLENPVLVLRDIEGIKNLLDLSRTGKVKRFFYSSSSEVYGEPVEFPQNEKTTPLNSRLPYAIVKNVGESFIRSYHQTYGLNYTIFRFFNTYGPRQSEDFVITRFLRQALGNLNLTLHGDGSQTRTFCYIDDNIETTVRCLTEGHCINEVINVGSDQEISIRQLADLVIRITGTKSRIEALPALLEGDMTRRCPDNARMRNVLNRPLLTLEDGIRKTLDRWKTS